MGNLSSTGTYSVALCCKCLNFAIAITNAIRNTMNFKNTPLIYSSTPLLFISFKKPISIPAIRAAAFIRNYAGISSTSTNTLITGTWGLALGVDINEPDTGGTNSGCRLTATGMWWLPTTCPDVESKPFQPAPGR